MSNISRKIKARKDLVAFIRDTADESIFSDFPTVYHSFLSEMVEKMTNHTETRIVIQQARQMGKTNMAQMFVETFIDGLDKPTYIKKFYLRSGTFEFRLYVQDRRWELIKLTKPSKWRATNLKYIFKFLEQRGATRQDILEIERKVFERI